MLRIKLIGLLIFCSNITICTGQKNTNQKPNIIYILADDLGYGDLSSYGQTHFKTPNIDALANSGIKFTQHYSGSTVCAPSRSTLMTGQHTGHTPIRGNKEVKPEGQHPIASEVFTLGELMQSEGYVTGAFGKWGLGYPGSEGAPTKQGFDVFFGYNCQRIGHNYYPYYLRNNEQKAFLKENVGSKEGTYAPELIHKKTLEFIEANKNKPFFAYVPSIIPHAELKVPEKYLRKYRGKLLPEKSVKGCDFGCKSYKNGGYGSQEECHATFAAMIDLLDEQVGEIVAKVKELGLDENTLIIFTSDNGPHKEGGADPNYFDSNGVYRGYKRDLYEGGIRVPMIAQWKGKIKPNSVSNHVSAFWDVFSTFKEITGSKKGNDIDGISFLPTLLGKKQTKHKYMYWEFPTHYGTPAQAVLMGSRWKAIRKVKKGVFTPLEIYDLKLDPSESNNIAATNPKKIKRALKIIQKEHKDSPVSRWNFKLSTIK